jgi:predicted membrane protein
VLTIAALGALAALTLLVAVTLSSAFMLLHLIVDAVLAGYLYLVWERANRSGRRASSLVTLREAPDAQVRSITTAPRRRAVGD